MQNNDDDDDDNNNNNNNNKFTIIYANQFYLYEYMLFEFGFQILKRILTLICSVHNNNNNNNIIIIIINININDST